MAWADMDSQIRYQSTSKKKEKIDELGVIKIKNFCTSKYTTKKVKRQLTKWATKFANHMFEKGFPGYIKNSYSTFHS